MSSKLRSVFEKRDFNLKIWVKYTRGRWIDQFQKDAHVNENWDRNKEKNRKKQTSKQIKKRMLRLIQN